MTGRRVQAYHWYEVGHRRGHFASVWQRSLYNVKGLRAQPWWTPKETGYSDLVKVRRSAGPLRAEGDSWPCSPGPGEELEEHPGGSSGCDGPEERAVPS